MNSHQHPISISSEFVSYFSDLDGYQKLPSGRINNNEQAQIDERCVQINFLVTKHMIFIPHRNKTAVAMLTTGNLSSDITSKLGGTKIKPS